MIAAMEGSGKYRSARGIIRSSKTRDPIAPGGPVAFRRNSNRPDNTPGRGLPWPESIRAAWAAAEAAGMTLAQFAKGVSRASGDLVSATTTRRYVEGMRVPKTFPCREAIRRALNFTNAELPPKFETDIPSEAFRADYPNAMDLAWQRLLMRGGNAFWPDGPTHDINRSTLYAAREHAGREKFSDCVLVAQPETENL